MTTRNDSTRPAARLSNGRRARSVVARQGQVLLDVDLNEQAAAVSERLEVETVDSLGSLAVPFHAAGFSIGPGGTISKGRLYLDGLLVENLADCTLATQPHPAPAMPAAGAVVGLKALVRLIDPVEDRALADKGFGDAAAAGRGHVDWQVFPVPIVPASAAATCGIALPDWNKVVAPSSGRLAARTNPGNPAANFCSPAVGGGFTRLENLHYRVEVDGGTPIAGYPVHDGPRFGLAGLRLKFSRRNASVMTRIIGYNGRVLQVDPPVLDAGQWFAFGTVAEIVSIHDDVDAAPAAAQTRLFTVAEAKGDTVTLGGAAALPLPVVNALAASWYLRLWDSLPDFTVEATAVPDGGGAASVEIDLGDGIGITLRTAAVGDTIFRRGDYWSFTARVDGTIDWPQSAPGVPVPRRPDGPAIHYGRLGVAASPTAAVTDCRPLILPLTEQGTLHFAGGDGQAAFLGDSATPFVQLRAPLRVLVLRGGLPLANARVRWTSVQGNVRLNGGVAPIDSFTNATGHTEVTAALDRNHPEASYAIEAALALPAGQPAVAPLRFFAGFDTAARTSYQPGDCALLGKATNVQTALDTLCRNIGGKPDTLVLTQIAVPGRKQTLLIHNGLIDNGFEMRPDELAKGVLFMVDRGPLANAIKPFDPIVDIELEIPYPTTSSDAGFWREVMKGDGLPFGTHRLRLDGPVAISGKEIFWRPGRAAEQFLLQWAAHFFGIGARNQAQERKELRILGRMRLRSQFIWIETGKQQGMDPLLSDSPMKKGGGQPINKGAKSTETPDKATIKAELGNTKLELANGNGTERIYLNAEHLGVAVNGNGRALNQQDRDPQRAADLDLFFYLVTDGKLTRKPVLAVTKPNQ